MIVTRRKGDVVFTKWNTTKTINGAIWRHWYGL